MRKIFTLITFVLILMSAPAFARARWTEAQAAAWQKTQPWPVGGNFLPSTAGNQLEMWQKETWDPATINRELGYAEKIGMNTMRVFLHDLLWQSDADGFSKRINEFLTIADKHHIKPVFVLFDSCWDPQPHLGPQRQPTPGVHNSVWVQGPGIAMEDRSQDARYETYVKGVIGRFANDKRILAWDLWNEPDNEGGGNYKDKEPHNKDATVAMLLPKVFDWARSANPVQPLTSGVWHEKNWGDQTKWNPTMRTQLTQSDIITFHDYGWPEEFEARIKSLLPLHRPILCTEYMARGNGSTFDDSLPIAARYNVGAINWGLVQGKMQTELPWESWDHPYIDKKPPIWFHDVFHKDGRPYRKAEAQLIRNLTQRKPMWTTPLKPVAAVRLGTTPATAAK